MNKTRLSQKEVYYPYYAMHGTRFAIFYDYTLFADSTESIVVPALGRKFKGGAWVTRQEACEAMRELALLKTGLPCILDKENPQHAVSVAWKDEPRITIGL